MNKLIEDDEDSDDENEDFLYKQNLFSGYEEKISNPKNTESISENEIENLINTIDLEEWYKIENKKSEFFEELDNWSESSNQIYKGFMADEMRP